MTMNEADTFSPAKFESMDDRIVVQGFPMTTPAAIIVALTNRLGGSVELTPADIEAAKGAVFTVQKDRIIIEAND